MNHSVEEEPLFFVGKSNGCQLGAVDCLIRVQNFKAKAGDNSFPGRLSGLHELVGHSVSRMDVTSMLFQNFGNHRFACGYSPC